MKITVIGIGLIGGSLALDLREIYPDIKIYGIDSNSENIQKAIDLNIIDHKSEINQVSESDLIIISVPVDKANAIANEALNLASENTLVIDVGSTKSPICEALAKHPKRKNFLACHPIAGTEFSGPSAALKGLFRGKTNIICEVEKTSFKLQEKAVEFFQKIGMRLRYMDAESHDLHIAYVSHLSHISSFMLGKTVIDKEKHEDDIFDMAGSGFASTVRLAKSSPEMWTPIFKQNKENVLNSMKEYISNLKNFQKLLEDDDYITIYSQMQQANHIKHILKEI